MLGLLLSPVAADTTPLATQLLDNLPHEPAAYAAACANPANPVVAENCRPGTDAWIIRNHTQEISLYPAVDSVNLGGSLDFFVQSAGAAYSLSIYRNGYYAGLGGRLVQHVANLPGQWQPACIQYPLVGLGTCSRWLVSYTLAIPTDWVSGIYIAVMRRLDTGGENYTVFVVRDDQRDSAILYQQSVATYQAYNQYAGKSLYSHISSICPTVAEQPRAVKVSLNRPYYQPQTVPNLYFRAEYPMVRWLEAQGYDVTYSTSMDTHRSGKAGARNELLDHPVFLAVGHDEYWSKEMRAAITAARDAGVHLGFFTSNTSFWRIRFEPDPVTGEPDSVMVTYKTTESGPPDPGGEPTTTWRDPQGANDPENSLQGVMYVGDNGAFFFPLRITAARVSDRIYRNTGLEAMPPNTYVDVGDQIVGWEWDAVVDNGRTPDGLTILAETPVYGSLLQDAGNYVNNRLSPALVHTTRYVAPSGAIVFATGTIQWSWGLGARGLVAVEPDPTISQMTYNLLSDMDAQPATPAGIVLDGDLPPLDRPLPDFLPLDLARPPVISDVQTALDGDSVTITWDTDVEAIGQLWFGERTGYVNDNKVIDQDYVTRHSLTVTGLQSNRTYFFKITSIGRNWASTISEEYQFATGSISLKHQLSDTFLPLVKSVGCWVKTNPADSIPLILAASAFSAVLGFRLVVTIGRRRSKLVAT